MTEGTLVEWLVAPGDLVHHGQVIAVVDTAKSAIEIEVFEDGVVDRLLVGVGESVPVGTPLAMIAPAGKAVLSPASPVVRHLAHELDVDLALVRGTGRAGAVTRADVERAAHEHAAPVAPPVPSAPANAARIAAASSIPAPAPAPTLDTAASVRAEQPGHVQASPFARRRAVELSVDLAGIPGTGPGGAITVADVEAGTAEREAPGVRQAPTARRSGGFDPAAMRAAIGDLMARSKREIPHYYLQATVDLHAAMCWLESHNSTRPVSTRVLPAALMLKAAALGVHEVPEVNGFWANGSFERAERVHLGVAVALRGGGLVAPALHDADQMPIDDLMASLKDLVARARAGRLRGSEMADPTLTVTNLGEQGAELVHGVIYPPQVALVGFGRVVERPWAVDGMLAVRPLVTVTLAADHRVTDGHRGGLYLAALAAALQHPEAL